MARSKRTGQVVTVTHGDGTRAQYRLDPDGTRRPLDSDGTLAAGTADGANPAPDDTKD